VAVFAKSFFSSVRQLSSKPVLKGSWDSMWAAMPSHPIEPDGRCAAGLFALVPFAAEVDLPGKTYRSQTVPTSIKIAPSGGIERLPVRLQLFLVYTAQFKNVRQLMTDEYCNGNADRQDSRACSLEGGVSFSDSGGRFVYASASLLSISRPRWDMLRLVDSPRDYLVPSL